MGKCREGEDVLTLNDKMGEFMMLGLRKCEGVSVKEFEDLFGCDMKELYNNIIDKFIKLGALEMTDDRLRLTDYGMDISNTVMCEFL